MSSSKMTSTFGLPSRGTGISGHHGVESWCVRPMVPPKGSNVTDIRASYRSAAGGRDARARRGPRPDRAICSKEEGG